MTAVSSSFSSSVDVNDSASANTAASAIESANLCSLEIPDKYFHFGIFVHTFFMLSAADVYQVSSVTYFLE